MKSCSLVVSLSVLLLCGCKAGTSSVLVRVIANEALAENVTHFDVYATRTGQDVQTNTESVQVKTPGGVAIPTSADMPQSFALRFESAIKGDLTLHVKAFGESGQLATGTVPIIGLRPGKAAAPVLLILVKGQIEPIPDGGTNDIAGDGGPPGVDGGSSDSGTPTDLPECVFDDDMSTFDNCVFAP